MVNSLLNRATAGVTGALSYDPLEYCILAAGTAIAWAYTIELDLLVFYTFRRRKGLYFWSLLISSWGCSLHALGFILKFLVGTSWLTDLPFIEVGWVAMVTGQAVVLYSRLHLVVRNPRTLRVILWMIIFDAFALHVPTIVFTYGSNSPNASQWTGDFNVMERIQLTGFCLQEFVISTVYIVATVRLLGSIYHSMTRKVMLQLLLINCICIGMDIVLIGLEFSNNYVGEASVKPMIYSIKLKLEFAVLNQLMGLTKAGFTEENQFGGNGNNGSSSHEMGQRRAMASHDPEAIPNPRKAGQWTSVKGIRGSISGARMSMAHPEEIFKTEQVEITNEPKSPKASEVSSAGATTLVSSNHPNDPPGKVKSLMGTPIVHMPGRGMRHSRPDSTGREDSLNESEKGITRNSEDSEKEGTRWIEGVPHVE